MLENGSNNLDTTLNRLIALSETLLDLLDGERNALVARATDKLDALTARKAELCAAIESTAAELGARPLKEIIADLPASDRNRLEPLHVRLVTLVQRTQDLNAVNGKIIHRAQQSTRELMHLMSGTDTDTLYSGEGYTARGRRPGGPGGAAIARA